MSTRIYDFTTEYEKALFAVTKQCAWCGDMSIFDMTYRQHEAYIERETYIQDIFPHIAKELRETLISGTHPECWDEMFAELDSEEEEEVESYVGNE